MSQKKLLDLVEALREAGQREHGIVCDYGEATICPADGCIPGPCECGADRHNAAVNEAAKALRAEIEDVSDGSRIIADMIPLVQKGFDFDDGDVFGILHNDAVDAIGEAKAFIAKHGEPT